MIIFPINMEKIKMFQTTNQSSSCSIDVQLTLPSGKLINYGKSDFLMGTIHQLIHHGQLTVFD